MNNKDLFELSIANCKMNFDFSNPKGTIVIPENKEQDNELTKANNKIIELITTYKTIRNNPAFPNSSKEQIIYDIMKIIDTVEHINYSSLCVYFQVLRFSWNSFKNAKSSGLLTDSERAELLKNAVNLYIDNRYDMYMSHGYSNILLQVQSDCSSSRRSGNIGTKSLTNIMSQYNISFANNYDDFMDKDSYFYPEDNVELLLEIVEKNKIDFNFRKERDNKNPDLMFKINDQIYILEHKLASGRGGSQNMELNEIINFIGQPESNTNVHYISCLQGDNLKKLTLKNADPKTKIQYQNITSHLDKFPNNYFVNEFGLCELLKLNNNIQDN